jgi:hypothetical protein
VFDTPARWEHWVIYHRWNQSRWVLFLAEYMKCINLLTVSRDYVETDLAQLSCAKSVST